jgi:hypothetical protein
MYFISNLGGGAELSSENRKGGITLYLQLAVWRSVVAAWL